jgi:transposase InsO family protein
MKLHGNARTCVLGRLLIVRRVLERGWTLTQAAEAAGVSVRTVSKWLARFRAEGADGLLDRSSAPALVPHRTPADRTELIALLRRLRMTAAEIAATLAMPLSTVSAILTPDRSGPALAARAARARQPVREAASGRARPRRRKKLGRIGRPGHRVNGDRRTRSRGIGWEYVHIAVDDATRLAYVEVLEDEKATTAAGFLRRAVSFFRRFGIRVTRVITDNGSANRSLVHALACKTLGLKHSRTRPYRPRTNGKAERFIRTMLAGWAYGAVYRNSDQRRQALPGWVDFYNRQRPHASLSRQSPLERLHALRNNVAGSYT